MAPKTAKRTSTRSKTTATERAKRARTNGAPHRAIDVGFLPVRPGRWSRKDASAWLAGELPALTSLLSHLTLNPSDRPADVFPLADVIEAMTAACGESLRTGASFDVKAAPAADERGESELDDLHDLARVLRAVHGARNDYVSMGAGAEHVVGKLVERLEQGLEREVARSGKWSPEFIDPDHVLDALIDRREQLHRGRNEKVTNARARVIEALQEVLDPFEDEFAQRLAEVEHDIARFQYERLAGAKPGAPPEGYVPGKHERELRGEILRHRAELRAR